jgi:pyruvate dehydrogenase kinase 2/3/4
VCNWYKQSFQELLECETPTDIEKESKFAVVVEGIYRRHGNTLLTMAKGAHELRKLLQHDTHGFAEMKEIQNALDSFYMSRIGIRILISHYLALKAPQTNSDMVGIVCMNASPYDIARNAISDASYMCSRVHHDAPEVTIHGRTDLTFPYIPDHIHYMLVELLKNSMRATVEYHGIDNMPPIKIIIADGEDNEDVVRSYL